MNNAKNLSYVNTKLKQSQSKPQNTSNNTNLGIGAKVNQLLSGDSNTLIFGTLVVLLIVLVIILYRYTYQRSNKEILKEIQKQGINSMGIVAIISVFMGAVITIQTAYNTENPLLPTYLIGLGARDSILLEFSSSHLADHL